MEKTYDVLVVGGGVVGCAILRKLSSYRLECALLERYGDVAEGISKANSGVLHAGFNVRQGSLKALFNLEGLAYFPALAQELNVDYRYCGKLVVARDGKELPYLEKLLEQGRKNGCTGMSIISRERIHELEPLVQGEWALLSESTGIITPFQLTVAFAENAVANGAQVFLNAEVCGINSLAEGGYRVQTADGRVFRSRVVVNSAGNQAAEIANLLQPGVFHTHPCRGEYYVTDKNAGGLLKMAVYPVPPADGSGLGVHLTPTMNGNLLVGPSAEYITDAEDLGNSEAVMNTLKEEAYQLLPQLRDYPLIKTYSGMRPKLFRPDQNSTFEDFHIAFADGCSGFINLIGIESPGLTSSPAIARYVVEDMIGTLLDLRPDQDFRPEQKGVVRGIFLSPQELDQKIRMNPAYAEIICRCERVSRAEIEQALHNPLGARTLNAIKKRTHATMGRCQGGFCLPNIVRILRENGIEPQDMHKQSADDFLFLGSLE